MYIAQFFHVITLPELDFMFFS